MHTHVAEHAIGYHVARVDNRLSSQINVLQQLRSGIQITEQNVVLVHCQRGFHPGRQDSTGLKPNLHQDRIRHQIIARICFEKPCVFWHIEFSHHGAFAWVYIDIVKLATLQVRHR